MADEPREDVRRTQIVARAAAAGVAVTPDVASACARYLAELARWNRKLNLTALPLEPATDAAIDRLVIEPLIAAAYAAPGDRLAVDIGSGGGSPAIPFTLAVPDLRMVMVETKSRKCAFLRAVVRELELGRATVDNSRLADFRARAGTAQADIVTVRAVRADQELLDDVQALLRPGGRLFWFGTAGEVGMLSLPASFRLERTIALPAAGPRGGELAIFLRL